MKKYTFPWQMDLFVEKNWEFQYLLQSPQEHKYLSNAIEKNLEETASHCEIIRSNVQQKTNALQNLNAFSSSSSKVAQHIQSAIVTHNSEKTSEKTLENFQKIPENTENFETIIKKISEQSVQIIQQSAPNNSENKTASAKNSTPKKSKNTTNTPKDIIRTVDIGGKSFDIKYSKDDDYVSGKTEEWVTLRIRKTGEKTFMHFKVYLDLPELYYQVGANGESFVAKKRFLKIHKIQRTDSKQIRHVTKQGQAITNFQYFAYAFNVLPTVRIHDIIKQNIWLHITDLWTLQNPNPDYQNN